MSPNRQKSSFHFNWTPYLGVCTRETRTASVLGQSTYRLYNPVDPFFGRPGVLLPKKDYNKCGLLHNGRQVVYHTSVPHMNTGHVLCFRSTMKQLDVGYVRQDSGPSRSTVGHIAHESYFIANKQRAHAVIHYHPSHSAC